MRIKKTEIYDIVKVMSMLLVVFEHVFRMYTPTFMIIVSSRELRK